MKKPALAKKKKSSSLTKKYLYPVITLIIVLLGGSIAYLRSVNPDVRNTQEQLENNVQEVLADIVPLPSPSIRSNTSLEATLKNRRSRRDLKPDPLSLKQVSQLLWSAQGVTSDWGGRTAPSAKSVYPVMVYLLVNNVDGLDKGLYKYIPGEMTAAHQLVPVKLGDFQDSFYEMVNQASVKNPPVIIFLTGNMQKMAEAFGGTRRDANVYLEVGHIGQNLYLQVESLKLGMVTLSSVDGSKFQDMFGLPIGDELIYTVPVGYPNE